MEKTYLKDLESLKQYFEDVPNTHMMAIAKISSLIILNMRYEKIMLNRELERHPYDIVQEFINDTRQFASSWKDISYIEDPAKASLERKDMSLETGHQELFQQLWVNFSAEEYEDRINRYVHRLRINELSGDFLEGKNVIDFGCGHGNFDHAILREGASMVYGFDFGEDSIKYAKKIRDELGVSGSRLEFEEASVYKVPKPDNTFDLAIQNGVFHHLEDEDSAIQEVARVLKPGGWLWYYTDGAGGISYDLWDASVYMLRNLPHEFIISYLAYLNIETGKRYHLGDGLQAVYRHTTYEEITTRLQSFGFGNFRRLVGGFPTDFDHDVIASDKYGQAKFGEGDLRILCQLIEK